MAISTGAALIGSALIGGASSIIGGSKASKAQVKANQAAIDFQKYMYDTTRADMAPWRTAGGNAITAGAAMLQPGYDHTTSPGYQFRLDEGMRSIQNGAAARGGLLTGGTLKDIMRYGQGVAADDFNDQFNRQMAIAAGGQQANSTVGQIGGNTANSVSQLMQGQGQARASGYGAINQGIQGTLSNLMMGQQMGLFGGGGGGGNGGAWGIAGSDGIY